ncbi:ABC transporter permease [Streptomyces sp. NPDC048436]|uniref:ABC transporter permease n=1 Tax=Streptomyces sp. NPDC048436 TaxID=3365550 RepID=UPI0037238381
MVLRELRVQWRYPLSMINLVLLTPLYEMAIPTLLLGTAFLVDDSSVGLTRMVGTDDLVGWIGLGVLVASVMTGAVRGVSGTLQSDRQTGALEHSWAGPVSRDAFVLGAVGAGTIFTAGASALLLAFGIGVLGADYDPTGVLLSLPVVLALLVGNCGFGYLAAAAALLLRRPAPLLDPLTGLAAAFSGVAFPLTVLPEAVRWLTFVLPTTWSLDLMRWLTLDTRTLVPLPYEVTALVVTSLGFLLLGRRIFLRAERKVQTTGALTQF